MICWGNLSLSKIIGGGGHPAPPHPFILQNCVIYYVYFYFSDYAFVQYPGYTSLKRAQLMSRIFSPTRGATISFSYYISGTSSRNNLKLVLKGNGQEKSLWKVSGNKGGKWMKAEITYFSPSSYNVSVI